ncbi:MAG: hypothetical protein ACYTEO_19455, partial [Planctomycetota bacterium]
SRAGQEGYEKTYGYQQQDWRKLLEQGRLASRSGRFADTTQMGAWANTQYRKLWEEGRIKNNPNYYSFYEPATTADVIFDYPDWLPQNLKNILAGGVTMTGGPPALRKIMTGSARGASPLFGNLYKWLPPGLQQALGIPPEGQPEAFELLYGGEEAPVAGGTVGALAGLTDDFMPGGDSDDYTDYSWPVSRRSSYTPRSYPVSARSGPRTPRGRRSLGLTSWRI